MIYAAVHVDAGHNAIFFYSVTLWQGWAKGLVGSCLYQMISYSVIEIFSSCDERRALL